MLQAQSSYKAEHYEKEAARLEELLRTRGGEHERIVFELNSQIGVLSTQLRHALALEHERATEHAQHSSSVDRERRAAAKVLCVGARLRCAQLRAFAA